MDFAVARGDALLSGNVNDALPDSRYSYEDIPSVGQVIRILHLYPGDRDAKLQGKLETCSLQSDIAYDALSYAWGSSQKPFKLFLGSSGYVPITASLFEAMLRLRKQKQTRTFWIDAVCINQENAAERAGQVRLMGAIFKTARQVLCWLGEDEGRNDAADAMNLLLRIGQVSFRSTRTGHVPSEQTIESSRLPEPRNKAWYALVRMYTQPWFRRCWVVQEFVMGRTVRLIYGTQEADWRDLAIGNVRMIAYQLFYWGLSAVGSNYRKDSILLAEAASKSFGDMIIARRACAPADSCYYFLSRLLVGDETHEDLEMEYRSSGDEYLGFFLHRHSPLVGSPYQRTMELCWLACLRSRPTNNGIWGVRHIALPLATTAFQYKNSFTTDPRDKLFALLGMSAEGAEPALQPSYTEPVASVYIRFARYLISNEDRASTVSSLLRAGLHSRRCKPTLQLPSWVYDWSSSVSATADPLIGVIDMKLCYSAARNTSLVVSDSSMSDQIEVTGGLVDTLNALAKMPELGPGREELWSLREDGKLTLNISSPEKAAEYLQLWSPTRKSTVEGIDIAFELQSFFNAVDALNAARSVQYLRMEHDEEATRDAIWRTLTGNIGSPKESSFAVADKSTRAEYLELRNWLAMRKVPWDFSAFIEHAFSPAVGGWLRTFLVMSRSYATCDTTSGFVGLVPRCAARGDEVHLLLGVCMPVVLRPTSEARTAYELVGPCYMHGIMQGEFLRDPGWKQKEITLV